MKVALHTIGCKVNFAETSQIREKFEHMGYDITEFGEEADIIILNTCTVTNKADADARKLIRRSKRKFPNAFIGVMGCYAQLKPEEVAEITLLVFTSRVVWTVEADAIASKSCPKKIAELPKAIL